MSQDNSTDVLLDAPIEVTQREKLWIDALFVIIAQKPRALHLFANGDLHVLKGYAESPEETPRVDRDLVDQARVVAEIVGACEGGDF